MNEAPTSGCQSRNILLAAVLLLSTVAWWQLRAGNPRTGWVPVALRNWADYGYGSLRGRVVINAGGIAPGEPSEIYQGYRGYSLLPLYGLLRLTGNLAVAEAAFYLLLSVGLAAVVWFFLGRDFGSALAAVAFCCSPGIIRAGVSWDPVPGTVLLGLPVILGVAAAAASGRLRTRAGLMALGLLVLLSQSEWASAFALAMCGATLLALSPRQQPRQRWALIGLLILLLVVGPIWLMLQKSGSAADGPKMSALTFLYHYTISPLGYDGRPMTWVLALRRLLVASAVGLWPLWCVAALYWTRLVTRNCPAAIRSLLPVGAAWVCVLSLRNPMAAHQWIPTAVVGVGLVLSLYVMRQLAPAALPRISRQQFFAAVAFCAAYQLTIGVILRASTAELEAVVSVVQNHTRRSDLIGVGPGLEELVRTGNSSLLLDRKVEPFPYASGMARFLLTTEPQGSPAELVAHAPVTLPPLIGTWLRFYREKILQRHDRSLSERSYYLYRFVDKPSGS